MAKRILVAEDEPNIAGSLQFVLERAGYQVLTESHGDKVIEKVRDERPDAMILDVMLPGADGYEILRDLRNQADTVALPVLVLTAKTQREDRQMAMDAGANMFMTKPFANAEIVDAVMQMLNDQ